MKKWLSFLTALFMVFGLSVSRADAVTVVDDHFNNGILDPAWSLTLSNASGWTYGESGTNLTVTDITPTVINPLSGGTWAKVSLSQTFTPLTDFKADFDSSYDTGMSLPAMQMVNIVLRDTSGNGIAWAGYDDAWVGNSGRMEFYAAGPSYITPMGYWGYSASIDIVRTGGAVDIFWDGTHVLTGANANPLNYIAIEFWYYAYNGAGGPSFFGTESVDFVRVDGTTEAAPEPSALLLIMPGLAGFWMVRRLGGKTGKNS